MPSPVSFGRNNPIRLCCGLLLALIAAIPLAYGQATPTSQRKADISVFALYSRLTPDYGPTPNNGYTLGASYTRLTRWWINPSAEFRVKVAKGTTVDEKSFGGGVRGVKTIGRFSPYADFMVGYGSIDFHLDRPQTLLDGSPYRSDSTIVYSYGGGMDYRLARNFSARGDYQFERWYLDKATTEYAPLHLSPSAWSLGVVYRLPFGR